jgi:cytochrome c peroxidase
MPRHSTRHVPSGLCAENLEDVTTGRVMRFDTVFSSWQSAVICVFVIIAMSAAASPLRADDDDNSKVDTPNDSGVLRTVTLDGGPLSDRNLFFKSLGTNGRSCGTCHVPSAGWTLSPPQVQDRFDRTDGRDPLFRTVDGSNSPLAKVNTLQQRRDAYSMLLNRGVIRVGLPVPAPAPAPGAPGADFALVAVDDPYGYASAKELSLFRRPLPSTNLRFLTGIMWDGRETVEPFSPAATPEQNFTSLVDDLMHQANDATMGHAQGLPLNQKQQQEIAAFELNLVTAQRIDARAGVLTAQGAFGGPEYLAAQPFYITINDVLGADAQGNAFVPHSMTLFDAWADANSPRRAAIARGAALFGSKEILVKNVRGINDDLNIPVLRGTCTTCHDSPNVANHSVSLPIDIGITDASRRTPDMPLYTFRNLATGIERQTTDPGRALLTGRWKDIGKFKGPILRGVAARAPYFHDGSAADLNAVLDFYQTRFDLDLTRQERSDLIAFLNSL